MENIKEQKLDTKLIFSDSLPQTSSSSKKVFFITILVILLGFTGVSLGFIVSKNIYRKSQTQTLQPAKSERKNPQAAITTKPKIRSKVPGIIVEVTLAKEVDPVLGKPLSPVQQFFANDKVIYVAFGLNNPKVGTKVEYVRYLNRKYLDHRSITIEKEKTQYANFNWSLVTPLAVHFAGDYKVKLYTNGIFEKEVEYKVNRGLAYLYHVKH